MMQISISALQQNSHYELCFYEMSITVLFYPRPRMLSASELRSATTIEDAELAI